MPAELVDYLADPPGWMVGQLAKLRKDPERWFKPTCASIAQEVYSTATRWREEVEPALTWWLGDASR